MAERAQAIRKRKQEQGQIREQLSRVEREVKAANDNAAKFNKGRGGYGQEERDRLKAELGKLNEDLKRFMAQAQDIKEAAGKSNFKSIEHDAKKLIEALKSSSRKIDKAVGGQ